MRFVLSLVIILLVSSASAAPTNRILRTTAEIRALSDNELRQGLPVEIEGQLVAPLYHGGCIIADKTGGYVLKNVVSPKPEIGNHVALRGRTFVFDPGSEGMILSHAITVIGNRSQPVPRPTSIARIVAGDENYNLVRVSGFVSEVVQDENHCDWHWMVLRDHTGDSVYVSVPNAGSTDIVLSDLVDAEVEITGFGIPNYTAERLFVGPHLETWSRDCIRVTAPAPQDPFSAPYLADIYHIGPQELAKMRRQRIVGRVLAAWRDTRFLVKEDSGRLIEVYLSNGQKIPRADEHVEAVGFPGTDLFRINLSRALVRPIDGTPPSTQDAARDATPRDILLASDGTRRLQQSFHGKLIRLRGIVRSLPSPGNEDGRMNLDCDGYLVPIDMSANPAAADGLVIGCKLEATGVCIMETQSWGPDNLFPVFGGFTLVIRTPDDIRVLSRPSWWTPTRLLVVICSLFAALVAFFVWNRILNQLVDRRGRQLFREQIAHASAALKIGERTRLAVELHDALSQNLAGLACQIAAAKTAVEVDRAQAANHLVTAERMLLSSRTELRRCLWDLRGDTLELESMTEAVTKTVKSVVGTAQLSVRFSVPRSRLMDSTAHSILCIIRELAANAVRHGHAAHVRIAGEIHGDELSFSVRDDGTGFDVTDCPGIDEGHFGLQGIRERVNHLEGTFDLESSAAGTRAKVTLHVPHATPPQEEAS